MTNARATMDPAARVVHLEIQESLLLPIKVDLPFALIKGLCGSILQMESQQETQAVEVSAAAGNGHLRLS